MKQLHSLYRLSVALTLLVVQGVARAETATSETLLAEDDPRSSRNPIVETGSEKDHLLGDWRGWRTRFVERGVHFSAGYIAEGLSTFSGGTRQGTAWGGLGQVSMDLDLEKLMGWKRGYFRASSMWVHGDSATRKFAGNELTLSNIDAYDSVRLYELWFEQGFWSDRFWIRAGNLLADTEFAFSEHGGLFLNSVFGWPAFISGNTVNTGPAFNVPALGARVWYEPDARWYFQAGVYDGDTFDSAAGDPRVNANGTHFQLGGLQGVFIMAEAGFRLNHSEKATGLRGTYKLGTWQHTRGQIGYGSTPVPNHTYGFYAVLDQQLWREAEEQGLGAFIRLGGTPHERAKFAWVLDTGLTYTGLIPNRDEDEFGVGFAYAQHSHFLPTDHEAVVEATYKMQVTPWWSVQPNLQWVHHPAGTSTPDAWVAGIRTSITF
jgi:porin